MRKILLLPFLLMACTTQPIVTQDRYFTTVSLVKATGDLVEVYVDACNRQPKGNSCYKKFPAINSGAILLKGTMKTADAVFVTKDKARYDSAYTAAENAAVSLRSILKE